jgi:hypothetical protein
MATKTPTEIPRVLIVVVLGLIVIIVIFAVFPFLQQIFSPEAKASISNASETTIGCGKGGSNQPYYNYTWTFTLTNTGNVDEDVTVAVIPTPVFIVSSPLFTQHYQVPKAQSRLEQLVYPASSDGCYSDRGSQLKLQVASTNPP